MFNKGSFNLKTKNGTHESWNFFHLHALIPTLLPHSPFSLLLWKKCLKTDYTKKILPSKLQSHKKCDEWKINSFEKNALTGSYFFWKLISMLPSQHSDFHAPVPMLCPNAPISLQSHPHAPTPMLMWMLKKIPGKNTTKNISIKGAITWSQLIWKNVTHRVLKFFENWSTH